jgi:hypothetical protein
LRCTTSEDAAAQRKTMEEPDASGEHHPPQRYRWPWMVLGAVILGIIMAVLWMSREVDRMRRIRDLNAPNPATNVSVPSARQG